MKHDNGLDDSGMPRYRSSAAARMVNIPVATLRVWERRYKVVGPQQAPSPGPPCARRPGRRVAAAPIEDVAAKTRTGLGLISRLIAGLRSS